ncbi:MAG: c-type cytochrome biogenesis protein CcmI [Alphaproteobacteria bacterium]|nr:c-type cytochrome biogenesis protein CcmI [Alphaproteobacteria bacterium]
MLIWVLFALMTAALLAAVLSPLLARDAAKAASRHVLSSADVYRAQLAELEVERAAGRVAEAEYLAARAEIGRRLLKVAEREGEGGAAALIRPSSPDGAAGHLLPQEKGKDESGAAKGKKKLPLIAIAVTIAVPALALPLYLSIGHPDMPDEPLSARGPEVARARQMQALVGELEAKLRSGKGDAEGWMMLGRVKAQFGDPAAAIDAYDHAIDMLKAANETVPGDLYVWLGEAEMAKADGQVTPRALDAFKTALAVEPKNVGARFYIAESKVAAGDIAGALADYRALLADTPKDKPYRLMLEKRIGELEASPKK